jgi:hypothetical protein
MKWTSQPPFPGIHACGKAPDSLFPVSEIYINLHCFDAIIHAHERNIILLTVFSLCFSFPRQKTYHYSCRRFLSFAMEISSPGLSTGLKPEHMIWGLWLPRILDDAAKLSIYIARTTEDYTETISKGRECCAQVPWNAIQRARKCPSDHTYSYTYPVCEKLFPVSSISPIFPILLLRKHKSTSKFLPIPNDIPSTRTIQL